MIMNGKRIATGIEGLDPLIEGGVRAGKTYLILGEPGTGKTICALQFLHTGLSGGEKALYVGIDEKPSDIIDQAASLGWDLSPHIENKNFQILDASAYINSRVTEHQVKNDIHKVLVELNNHIKQAGATRVVIDPVGPLIYSSDSAARTHDQARVFFSALQKQAEITTLVTGQSAGRNARVIEEYLVAGTIVLELELANNRFVRTLTVEKMRSTKLDPAQYLFEIVSGKGIVLHAGET